MFIEITGGIAVDDGMTRPKKIILNTDQIESMFESKAEVKTKDFISQYDWAIDLGTNTLIYVTGDEMNRIKEVLWNMDTLHFSSHIT